MRTPTYVSPSQMNLWNSDREEYYLRYLADHRPPRTAQTAPMAVGGAFDSHVTRALAVRYFGRDDLRCGAGGEYDLDVMLESAIQGPDLDRSVLVGYGLELFKRYMATGAYDRLCAEIDASSDLVMQSSLYYDVPGVAGLTLMGMPDVSFVRSGVRHVYDFKCNGFFSSASPLKHFVWRGTGGTTVVHKGAILGKHSCGTLIDLSGVFDSSYLRQTSTYAWALAGGLPKGDGIIVGIEQLACRAASSRWKDPTVMREGVPVAVSCVSTRRLVDVDTQAAVLREYTDMWAQISTGLIFDDVSRAESDAICARLELVGKGLVVDVDEDFNKLCGR